MTLKSITANLCSVLVMIMSAALAGCSGTDPPAERVRIVAVQFDESGYAGYCTTTVEFPDGERIWCRGVFGKVGDEFMARKVSHSDGGWR